MKKWIQDNAQNAMLAAVVTCVLSAVGSLGGAFLTYYTGKLTQDRQARIEQVSKFEQSNSQIVDAGGQFIAAINTNKDLNGAKLKLSTVVATQLHESENLRRFFDEDVNAAVNQYQSALSELNQIAQKTSTSTEMRLWAESFGKALDAKTSLSNHLFSAIGIPNKVRRSATQSVSMAATR